LRRVRPYPGTVRGLFASPDYIRASGSPASPDDLAAHICTGSEAWKLRRGKKIVTPNILFRVVTSDPTVALKLAISGFWRRYPALMDGKESSRPRRFGANSAPVDP